MLGKKNTLQLHIASIFFIVVSVLSLVLIILSYQNSKALNEQLARERVEQNAEQVKLAFEKMVSPVLTALETLAASDFGHTLDASNDKNWLASVSAIMDVSPDMLAIYVGYENESSAFIRSTRPAFMRDQFSTPDNSYIMVDINQSNGDQVRTYYDKNLDYIGEKATRFPIFLPLALGTKTRQMMGRYLSQTHTFTFSSNAWASPSPSVFLPTVGYLPRTSRWRH
ncbi:hypothetical protein [Enterovibrio coralii]|uniref:hypothetical protein n=1 Tax=Enterovibrio coralii TaxID=294935 RepID=UPI000AE15281|nr:hypothetical protein [Enterovibrio coralii]